mgnify:CR=1 FL=1
MGKGSKLVKGGSWMSKHARNLLQDMPIDNRASGKGPGEYGKPKGPGKHHPDGPMKHGMMHDGPGEYGNISGNQKMREKTKFTPSGRLKDAPAKYDHKGPGEYGKMKGKGPAHKKQYSHTHEGVGDSISNTFKDFVGYKESGRNRYALGGLVKYKSDDWSSGYSDVQKKFKKAAPSISGKKD